MSKKYEQQCRRKWRHENYWSAMQHARRLSPVNIVIYPCGYCGGLHVGHARLRHLVHCDRQREDRVQSILRKIRRHRRLLREERERLNNLKSELEMLLINY